MTEPTWLTQVARSGELQPELVAQAMDRARIGRCGWEDQIALADEIGRLRAELRQDRGRHCDEHRGAENI